MQLKPEDLVDDFVQTLKERAYGLQPGQAVGNHQEGDYGTWDDWRKALIDFANLCRSKS